jgi:hypothetical protein
MKTSAVMVGLLVLFLGAPAFAENWVTVFDDEDFGAEVDADSLVRKDDGLVYFTKRTIDRSDGAADCDNRIVYTLKIYAHGGFDYPNWRNEGRSVTPGTLGDDIFRYVCANAY